MNTRHMTVVALVFAVAIAAMSSSAAAQKVKQASATKWFSVINCLSCSPPAELDMHVVEGDNFHQGETTEGECVNKAKAWVQLVTFLTGVFTDHPRKFSFKCVERPVKDRP